MSIVDVSVDALLSELHREALRECKSNVKSKDKNLKDPKTRLQEILQGNNQELPVYEVESVTGQDHDLSFKVKCSLPSLNIAQFGEGASRRLSEKIAAQRIIEELEALGLG